MNQLGVITSQGVKATRPQLQDIRIVGIVQSAGIRLFPIPTQQPRHLHSGTIHVLQAGVNRGPTLKAFPTRRRNQILPMRLEMLFRKGDRIFRAGFWKEVYMMVYNQQINRVFIPSASR